MNVSAISAAGQAPVVAQKIISDQLLAVVSVVMKSALYDGIGAVGVVTNAICLRVFWTMGFRDTINVSFFAITLADMGCLLSLVWMGICYNPAFADADTGLDSRSVQYLTGGWPKFYFTRVSGMITAYVTFERCLCTAIPLKIKVVLTPGRVTAIHALIYSVVALIIVPIYVSTRLTWRWFPARNSSLVTLEFVSNKDTINVITNSLNVLLYNGSFIFVVVCAAILTTNLNASKRWKSKNTRITETVESSSSKETRASRRVALIAFLYIACNLPGSLVSLAMTVFPEFNAGEAQQNLFYFVAAFMHSIEAVNATANILIYLRTSKKFVNIFLQSFGCKVKTKK